MPDAVAETVGDTVAGAAEAAARELAAAGVESPRLDAELLLAHVLGAGRGIIVGHPERVLGAPERRRFAKLIGRRAAREPVSRILGYREFWGRDFALGEHVLDPRPDSETLVEAGLEHLATAGPGPGPRILDLGTGSGCLLLSVLAEVPAAWGLGTDVSAGAIAAARENAARLGLATRACFAVADWAAPLGGDSGFDLVLANPPYIANGEIAGLEPEVAAYEPRLALSGGADGLAGFRSVARVAGYLLAPGGVLVVEVGAGQMTRVEAIFRDAGLGIAGKKRDLGGLERCLLARAQTKKERKNTRKLLERSAGRARVLLENQNRRRGLNEPIDSKPPRSGPRRECGGVVRSAPARACMRGREKPAPITERN